MLKLTKLSATVLIFYIMFYTQIWGDNHLILYGFAAMAVLSVLIHCIQKGSLIFDHVPYGIWNNLVVVVYAVITGLFVAVDFMTTIKSSITLLAFTIVTIAMCYVSAEEESLEWILKILIVLALLCSLYTFIRGTEWQNYGITMSASNNPHYLAGVLNLGIFSVVYLSRNRKKKLSFISVALVLLFSIVTIRCGSRKYLIANTMIEGVWAWAIVREGWKSGENNRRVMTLFLLILLAGVAYYTIHNVYLGSSSQLRMQNSNDMGNQYRILFYKESLKIFLEHPIFGAGLNQFKYLTTVARGNFAHSTYAEAIADFGFVGCVLYFTPIFTASYRIISRALKSGNNYSAYLQLAFCISLLFIGIGQVFFMEFHLTLAWSILLFYDQQAMDSKLEKLSPKQNGRAWKYIR